MFEIKITGDTMDELASNIAQLKTQFQTTPAADAATKPRKAKATPAPQPEPEADFDGEGGDVAFGEDEELEPAREMPETAKQVVDAGTGKPAPKTSGKDDTIRMTFDDVKVAAAKLVAKDQAKLTQILKTYEASKLSEVPKDKLGDFAADVMEALG